MAEPKVLHVYGSNITGLDFSLASLEIGVYGQGHRFDLVRLVSEVQDFPVSYDESIPLNGMWIRLIQAESNEPISTYKVNVSGTLHNVSDPRDFRIPLDISDLVNTDDGYSVSVVIEEINIQDSGDEIDDIRYLDASMADMMSRYVDLDKERIFNENMLRLDQSAIDEGIDQYRTESSRITVITAISNINKHFIEVERYQNEGVLPEMELLKPNILLFFSTYPSISNVRFPDSNQVLRSINSNSVLIVEYDPYWDIIYNPREEWFPDGDIIEDVDFEQGGGRFPGEGSNNPEGNWQVEIDKIWSAINDINDKIANLHSTEVFTIRHSVTELSDNVIIPELIGSEIVGMMFLDNSPVDYISSNIIFNVNTGVLNFKDSDLGSVYPGSLILITYKK